MFVVERFVALTLMLFFHLFISMSRTTKTYSSIDDIETEIEAETSQMRRLDVVLDKLTLSIHVQHIYFHNRSATRI